MRDSFDTARNKGLGSCSALSTVFNGVQCSGGLMSDCIVTIDTRYPEHPTDTGHPECWGRE